VTVNEGGSTGSAGFGTNLAPSMTIGTGFVGRSSLAENLQPEHLVNRSRIAYSTDASEVLPSFEGITPWSAPTTAVPPYPTAQTTTTTRTSHGAGSDAPARAPRDETSELREELRRLIVEELTTIIRG